MTAVVALIAAWLLAPSAVPIYDGIGNPDEPYRYVNPPANAKTTKTPTTARVTVPVNGSQSTAQFANTGEQGPQFSIYLPQKALQVPAGVTSVDVTAEPLAVKPPLPKDGKVVSNIYRVTAVANGKSLAVVGHGPSEPSIQMRAPTGQQPGPVFEHRTATGWQRTRTIRTAFDVYQTQAPVLGEWALVQLSSPASSSSSGGGINWGLLGGGVALLAIAIVVLMVRLRRTGAATS